MNNYLLIYENKKIRRVCTGFYKLFEMKIEVIFYAFLSPGGSLMGTSTRYYFGAYEKDIDRFGYATQTDYIYTPAGLTAMMKGGTLYYIHTDNLGSIQTITDESKNTISSYYYTPWGARVLLSGVNITDRGYTFHSLSRFLSGSTWSRFA